MENSLQDLIQLDDDIIVLTPTEKTKSKGPANKRKGSRVEREYANFFKNFDPSLTHCKTTRFTSRILDNCKIDLNFLPILVQIKAGEQKGLNISNVLQSMIEALTENLPQDYKEHSMPKIVVHHKDIPKGRRTRISTDTIVSMTFEDFLILFSAFLKNK